MTDGECAIEGCAAQAIESDLPGGLRGTWANHCFCDAHAEAMRKFSEHTLGTERYDEMDVGLLEVTAHISAFTVVKLLMAGGLDEDRAKSFLGAVVGPHVHLAMRGHYGPSGEMRKK